MGNRKTKRNCWIEFLKKISEDSNFSMIEFGELPTESISKKLQECDIGISTTSYDILGKKWCCCCHS